jgi:hypothetical protein
MLLATTQDLWYFIAAICALIVSGFLVWALYEIARLVHQVNSTVSETREKVERLENALVAFGEKFASLSQYLGLAVEGGKQAMTYLKKRERKSKIKKELQELENES